MIWPVKCACVCRYSVKLLIDQASLGPVESEEELHSTLHHYHQHWFIGMATERGWHDGVLQEKPFLFSLGHDISMVIKHTHTRPIALFLSCVFFLSPISDVLLCRVHTQAVCCRYRSVCSSWGRCVRSVCAVSGPICPGSCCTPPTTTRSATAFRLTHSC